MNKLTFAFLIVAVGLFALPSIRAAAETVDAQSVLDPEPTYEPADPNDLPDPVDVPGKEYSNNPDKDAAGNPDPGQTVMWEGDGTTVWDTFDYSTDITTGGSGGQSASFQVDALANIRDLYFKDLDGTRVVDQQQLGDTVSLLTSFEGDKNIYYSRSGFREGSTGKWADWSENINNTEGALDDLDGLEIWGPEDTPDADMYSRQGDGDPNDGGGRTSVWRFHPDPNDTAGDTTGTSVPYLRTQTLLDAVIDDNGQTIDWQTHDPDLFDVDAMLIWDVNEDDEFGLDTAFGGQYGNDVILFSIAPIAGLFDGGEIWLYEAGDATASFLTQGKYGDGTPRVWNTAHDVSGHFAAGASENINALEALPEPATLGLLSIGGLIMLRRRCRRTT